MLFLFYCQFALRSTRTIILHISGVYLLCGLTCCAHDVRSYHGRTDPHSLGEKGRRSQTSTSSTSLNGKELSCFHRNNLSIAEG